MACSCDTGANLGERSGCSDRLRGSSRGLARGQSPKLKAALDFLAAYEHPQAVEWVPELVIVSLWPSEKSDGPDLLWPAGLPTLEAASKNEEEGSYRFYLSRTQYEVLRPVMEGAKSGQKFDIANRLWRAYVHYPFPDELQFLKRMNIQP